MRRWLSGLFVTMALAGSGLAIGMAAAALLGDDPAPVAVGGDSPTPSTSAAGSAPEDTITTSTTAPTSATTVTTSPPPPPTTPVSEPAPDGLERGAETPVVLALQHRLTELGYWLGEPDGRYGHLTEQAVMAFQKAEGLSRDGVAGPVTQAALAAATGPPAPSAVTGDGLEIDLERQLLLVVDDGATRLVLNTSTGRSGWRTDRGTFEVERVIDGLRRAPLGDLYRPAYFNGGEAIHGATSIPGHAASHGCARVSFAAMDMLWADGYAVRGVPVAVY